MSVLRRLLFEEEALCLEHVFRGDPRRLVERARLLVDEAKRVLHDHVRPAVARGALLRDRAVAAPVTEVAPMGHVLGVLLRGGLRGALFEFYVGHALAPAIAVDEREKILPRLFDRQERRRRHDLRAGPGHPSLGRVRIPRSRHRRCRGDRSPPGSPRPSPAGSQPARSVATPRRSRPSSATKRANSLRFTLI